MKINSSMTYLKVNLRAFFYTLKNIYISLENRYRFIASHATLAVIAKVYSTFYFLNGRMSKASEDKTFILVSGKQNMNMFNKGNDSQPRAQL